MMYEKGISSCTTNMKWEESWLCAVSWALIPVFLPPNCVALGCLPDLSGSPSMGAEQQHLAQEVKQSVC